MLKIFTAFFPNQYLTLILAGFLDDSLDCTSYCKICDDYFQDQTMTCLSLLFEHKCLLPFHNEMESLNSTDWCVWDKMNR